MIQMVVAELAAGGRQHRHTLAVERLERGVAVDVDHFELEWRAGLQAAQAQDHVIAQVAPGPAVDGEPGQKLGQLIDAERDIKRVGRAPYQHGHYAALLELPHQLAKLLERLDVLVIDREDDVATTDAGARRRPL